MAATLLFKDRDLVLVQVLATNESYANGQLIDESSPAKLRVGKAHHRHRFGVDKESFRVILVGKDGGVKRQDTIPVRVTAIFEQIDAMPMRQQEMRSSRQKVTIKYKRVKVNNPSVEYNFLEINPSQYSTLQVCISQLGISQLGIC
ncbi:DUF4174 domain-containing protein [Nostoc sp.]